MLFCIVMFFDPFIVRFKAVSLRFARFDVLDPFSLLNIISITEKSFVYFAELINRSPMRVCFFKKSPLYKILPSSLNLRSLLSSTGS
ncbi:hypothetical protein MCHI_002215 [Candidatus Magnetoovum chiemensis]|nr:hypothetical protein MCHI_002215 [Candidatus Magnetoovum chiemensis]